MQRNISFKTQANRFACWVRKRNLGKGGQPMASNFHIFSYKTRDSLHLKLAGDFDGSSAHELIHTLIAHRKDFYQIFVDTNDLKTIHPFGNEVLQKKLSSFKKQFRNLIFIGENGHKFK